jgi:hypothetical protein
MFPLYQTHDSPKLGLRPRQTGIAELANPCGVNRRDRSSAVASPSNVWIFIATDSRAGLRRPQTGTCLEVRLGARAWCCGGMAAQLDPFC